MGKIFLSFSSPDIIPSCNEENTVVSMFDVVQGSTRNEEPIILGLHDANSYSKAFLPPGSNTIPIEFELPRDFYSCTLCELIEAINQIIIANQIFEGKMYYVFVPGFLRSDNTCRGKLYYA